MPTEVCQACGCHATAACWIETIGARSYHEGPCGYMAVTRLCTACDPSLAGEYRRVAMRRIDVLLPKGAARTRVGSLLFHPERKFWRYAPRDRYRAFGIDWQTVPEALTLPVSDPDLRRLKRQLGRDVVYRETDRHPRAP